MEIVEEEKKKPKTVKKKIISKKGVKGKKKGPTDTATRFFNDYGESPHL